MWASRANKNCIFQCTLYYTLCQQSNFTLIEQHTIPCMCCPVHCIHTYIHTYTLIPYALFSHFKKLKNVFSSMTSFACIDLHLPVYIVEQCPVLYMQYATTSPCIEIYINKPQCSYGSTVCKCSI